MDNASGTFIDTQALKVLESEIYLYSRLARGKNRVDVSALFAAVLKRAAKVIKGSPVLYRVFTFMGFKKVFNFFKSIWRLTEWQ